MLYRNQYYDTNRAHIIIYDQDKIRLVINITWGKIIYLILVNLFIKKLNINKKRSNKGEFTLNSIIDTSSDPRK